jgi:hypothetical protein
MPTIAGETVTHQQVAGTLAMLRYYRKFVRSEYRECVDLQWFSDFHVAKYFGRRLSRDEAQARLGWLVKVAINRKAGTDNPPGRKHDESYQISMRRDCQELRDHRRWRRRLWGLNGRRFENEDIQRRFGHMLPADD